MGRTAPVPAVSARTIERGLATLLLVLLAVYGIGKGANDAAPTLEAVGIVAVHLAVLVALAFPLAVIGDAAVGRFAADRRAPAWYEVVTAVTAIGTLAGSLWLSLSATPTVDALNGTLFAVAIASALLLAVLVVMRR